MPSRKYVYALAILLIAPFARAQAVSVDPDGALVVTMEPAAPVAAVTPPAVVVPPVLATVSGTAAAPSAPKLSNAWWIFPAGYFGIPSSGHFQTDALSVYQMKTRALTGVQTDLALVTHSTATTIMPKFLQAKGVPTIPWALASGAGGSLSGNAFVNINLSVNWTSVLATSIINLTGKSSSPIAAGVTDFFTQGLALPGNNGTLGFAGGVGLVGQAVNEGHFQSFAAAFPGRGPGAILENAACYTLGLAWKTL
jgi:hypothetical protein